MTQSLLTFTDKGIYCAKAKVYIDPWRPVAKAIITHAHADHARWGMKHYAAHRLSVPIMKLRLGTNISVEAWEYGEKHVINGVTFSMHPAGHIPGSAQIRVEFEGEIWVVSGDYKTESDPISAAFEVVPCDHFITESTFGLPVYQWKSDQFIFDQINHWWLKNKEEDRFSIIYGYSLGKSQRILSGISQGIAPILTHGAVENINESFRAAGLNLPTSTRVSQELNLDKYKGALIIAPPSAGGSAWIKKFKNRSEALASGWMALRGAKRRRNVDRGFVLSDHADWQGLNDTIMATGAENIYVTHGYKSIFSQWLREKGLNAMVLETAFEGELEEIGEGMQNVEIEQA